MIELDTRRPCQGACLGFTGVVMENLIVHQSPTGPRDDAGQLSLPGLDPEVPPDKFTYQTPRPPQALSHVARATGYHRARPRVQHHATRLLDFLRAHGPATDHECSAGLDLPLASINGARNRLVRDGLVVAVDHRRGPFGVLRTRWGLR